jgi:hypothetical protein
MCGVKGGGRNDKEKLECKAGGISGSRSTDAECIPGKYRIPEYFGAG